MFKIAYGGYSNLSDNEIIPVIPADGIDYRQQINFLLEFEIDISEINANSYYFLIKNEDVSEIDINNIVVSVKDATSNNNISYTLSEYTPSEHPSEWEDISEGEPLLVLKINNFKNSTSNTIKIIDCFLSDSQSQQNLYFRTYTQVDSFPINFLSINKKDIEDRAKTSKSGNIEVLNVNKKSQYYILISGENQLFEDEVNEIYSYPYDSLYYNININYNREGYSAFVNFASSSELLKYSQVYSHFSTNNICVIEFDKQLYNFVNNHQFSSTPFIQYIIQGNKSGQNTTFTVYFRNENIVKTDKIGAVEEVIELEDIEIRDRDSSEITTELSETSSNFTYKYSAFAIFSNGKEVDVTKNATWTENSQYLEFVKKGELVVYEVETSSETTITVSYEGQSSSLVVSLNPKILANIDIEGNSEIWTTDEEIQYNCIAIYDNSSSKIISSTDVDWNVEISSSEDTTGVENFPEITEDGKLTPNMNIEEDYSLTISATYSEEGVTKETSFEILVKNVYVEQIEIEGENEIWETDNVSYSCLATFNNGENFYVTPSWTIGNISEIDISSENFPEINENGDLTTYDVDFDYDINIQAEYSYGGETRNDNFSVLTKTTFVESLSIFETTDYHYISEINENSEPVIFTCNAIFNDENIKDLTNEVTWSIVETIDFLEINNSGELIFINDNFDVSNNDLYKDITIKVSYENYNEDVIAATLDFAFFHSSLVGSGIETVPFVIRNKEDLENINNDLNAYYLLIADIDLAEDPSSENYSQSVIEGNSLNSFNGHLNGFGFTIYNLNISSSGTNYIGLFSYIGDSGVVENLNVVGASISAPPNDYIGILAGWNEGTIKNCSVEGSIVGDDYIGGLSGWSDGIIENCLSEVTVSGDSRIAGIVGYNGSGGEIKNSLAIGLIDGELRVGGIVGENNGNITNCYSLAEVFGHYKTGGVVGEQDYEDSTILKSYAAGIVEGSFDTVTGVFIGDFIRGTIVDCFYDKDVNYDEAEDEYLGGIGRGSSTGLESKTTQEMIEENTFLSADWDFEEIWEMSDISGDYNGYPILKWQSE